MIKSAILFSLWSLSHAEFCFDASEEFGSESLPGEPFSNLDLLESSTLVSENYGINGAKVCATENGALQGIQLQIAERSETTWKNVILQEGLGIVSPCPQRSILGITQDNYITQLTIQYSSEAGVTYVSMETLDAQNSVAVG